MNYVVKFKEVELKEAVEEIKARRTVYYTYPNKENKTLHPVTEEVIQHVVFKSILDSEDIKFLVPSSYLKEDVKKV